MSDSSILSNPRHTLSVLIVARGSISSQLRNVLIRLGFQKVSSSSGYMSALVDAKENAPDLCFFDAEGNEEQGVDAKKFVAVLKGINKNIVSIALALESSGDDLFQLLQHGASSFLIPPLDAASVEGAFDQVKDGLVLGPELLEAEDRALAFAELIVQRLDDLASQFKSKPITEGPDKEEEVKERVESFDRLVKIGQFFCDKYQPSFMDQVQDVFVKRAEELDLLADQTRLRKTREKLRARRGK